MVASKDEIIRALIEKGSLSISISLPPEACTIENVKKINDGNNKDKIDEVIETHVKVMDDLVTVNSLFTIAVFVGLAFATSGQQSLENRPECDADVDTEKQLIVSEVISFALFLFSSLVAKSLKFNLIAYKGNSYYTGGFRILNYVSLSVCPTASIFGCVSLLYSMVLLLQIRLGVVKCRTSYTLAAAASLVVIVTIALVYYICRTILNIIHSMSELENLLPKPEVPNRQCA